MMLALAPLAVLLAAPAAPVEIGIVPVVRAERAPVLDGAPDPAWANAVARRLERSRGPLPQTADLQGSFRALWDDQALYVLVEVVDERRVANQAFPWGDDSVEVYVDGDASRRDGYDDRDDHQFVFRFGDAAVHHPKGPERPGVRFAQAAWDYGYRVEVALPWAAIGAQPGGAIGLDVHVNDNDGTGREDKLMWSDTADLAHGDPRRLGRAVLLQAATATPAQAAALTEAATDIVATVDDAPPLRLQYHDIRTGADGMIVPWSHDSPARAFDHVVRLVWGFWQRLGNCPNGVPYVLQHQVWKPEHDPRGLGGDQISMALSSWNLLHGYLGDAALVADMRRQADHWLGHGLTGSDGPWPRVPFPYNTDIHSGRYDGDMIAGKGWLQPDKAGSFGAELVVLYKITGERRYLDAAIAIADTLARNVRPGDAERSPWPFRVHAVTGQVFGAAQSLAPVVPSAPAGPLPSGRDPRSARSDPRMAQSLAPVVPPAPAASGGFQYTTNWTGALRLFDALAAMGEGRVPEYARARRLVLDWLVAHPLETQRWGPFFEDINIYSDTQINAGTLALYLLENPGAVPDAVAAVRRVLDGCDAKFGNPTWAKYGVRATNEQTAYEVPGNSHTSRQASLELLWAEASGDWSRKAQAVRNLGWATYMVDTDGKNRYYRDDVWLTDGYGDYVRHYLRAMAASPDLAPPDENHLLRTSSVVRSIAYGTDEIAYEKWDARSRERFKLGAWEPGEVEGGTMRWDAVSRVLEVEADANRVRIRRKGGTR